MNKLSKQLLFTFVLFSITFLSSAQCQVSKVYINAILANPSGSPGFDTDGDGTVSAGNDEFVQICNDSSGNVILTGWTLADAVGVRYTFGTDTIKPGKCLTIINNYSGSLPMPSYFRNRSSAPPIWNNTGDDIILANATDTCVKTYTASAGGCVKLVSGASNVDNCSLTPASLGSFPIPIELVSFSGTEDNGAIKLNWITATELNNDYFQIYKSLDGENFSAIASVGGAGNSSRLINYSYIDDDVHLSQYYRLKQVDYDGLNTNSDVILVKAKRSANELVEQTTSKLIVNPSSETRVVISNQQGQIVLDKTIDTQITINKNEYERGMFVIQAVNDNQVQTLKWVNVN